MKKTLSDVLFLIGALVLCYGVSMMHLPTAIILAGVFVLLASYAIDKAAKGGKT